MADVNTSSLRRTIRSSNEAAFARIARELTGWRTVSPFLGLTAAQQDVIENDYRHTEEQRYSKLDSGYKRRLIIIPLRPRGV